MAQTYMQYGVPMVLIDARTRRLAPDGVALGPNGMPPPGYSLSTFYLNDQNFLTSAGTNQIATPAAGVGAPGVTRPSGAFNMSQSPMPNFGGESGRPDWMPDWLQPLPSRNMPVTPPMMNPQIPNVTPDNVSQQPATTGGGRGIPDALKSLVTTPKGIAGLLSLVMAARSLTGGRGGSGRTSEGALLDEARSGMELQRKRVEQSQPAFDALMRMAYAGSPKNTRGAAPAGYTPGNPYPYESPKFGDR